MFEERLSYTTHDLDESPTSHGSFHCSATVQQVYRVVRQRGSNESDRVLCGPHHRDLAMGNCLTLTTAKMSVAQSHPLLAELGQRRDVLVK